MNFNQALDERYAHDDWRYADREAAYKFFFNLGRYPNIVNYVELLKEAQQIVESKCIYKRFIDGTPLDNDIAVWMADFVMEKLDDSIQETN